MVFSDSSSEEVTLQIPTCPFRWDESLRHVWEPPQVFWRKTEQGERNRNAMGKPRKWPSILICVVIEEATSDQDPREVQEGNTF